jgi:tryptophanyl-tRNA synthetase
MKNTEVPKVIGIDGVQKMSKSLNNHIELASTPEETRQRVMQMVTDPQRMRRTDPGNPDVCNVYSMHKIFSPKEEVDMVNVECRRAGIGCVDCKKRLAENMNKSLEPFRTKRAEIGKNPDTVWDVLHEGDKRARAIAEQTMVEVREAIQLPK